MAHPVWIFKKKISINSVCTHYVFWLVKAAQFSAPDLIFSVSGPLAERYPERQCSAGLWYITLSQDICNNPPPPPPNGVLRNLYNLCCHRSLWLVNETCCAEKSHEERVVRQQIQCFPVLTMANHSQYVLPYIYWSFMCVKVYFCYLVVIIPHILFTNRNTEWAIIWLR